ncbi:MAG: hypothetical protein OEY04_17185 [Gammaproteobacteria bacterium]|nr:hypothetical protein [Gammaproteobacteria bacterium]
MKIFVSRLLPTDSLELLGESGWTIDMYHRDARCPRDELLRRVRDCDAIMAQVTDRIDREVFLAAPELKVIACCGLGYDNIDLEAARTHDVVVCNAPAPELVATTAEAAVALLLGVAKRITRLHLGQQQDSLPPYSFVEPMGMPVRERTCGIVGAGRVGSAIARIMYRGFDNSIQYFNRSAKPEIEKTLRARRLSLNELLTASDFVFVTVPLTRDTRSMIRAKELGLLRRDAILINIARAGIVDDAALVERLVANKIFGAGLDVYEPVAASHAIPNLVLTAHMANGETAASAAVVKLAVRNVAAVLSGRAAISPVSH